MTINISTNATLKRERRTPIACPAKLYKLLILLLSRFALSSGALFALYFNLVIGISAAADQIIIGYAQA